MNLVKWEADNNIIKNNKTRKCNIKKPVKDQISITWHSHWNNNNNNNNNNNHKKNIIIIHQKFSLFFLFPAHQLFAYSARWAKIKIKLKETQKSKRLKRRKLLFLFYWIEFFLQFFCFGSLCFRRLIFYL